MKYPYFLLNKDIKISPVVRLEGAPHQIVLEGEMVQKALSMMGDSQKINDWFEELIKSSGKKWAVGAYLENRESILSMYEHMEKDKRYFHLGIDICAPAGTPVYAPLDCVVETSGYEEGEGNYGGYVILKHLPEDTEPFYSLYGHMSLDSLPEAGKTLKSGDVIALIGDLHENGGWNHHTHIQVITEDGRKRGYFFKGYCSESDLKYVDDLCPNPMPLLTAGFPNA